MTDPTTRTVDLVVSGAAEILTCAGAAPDLVGRTVGSGVAIDAGRIVAVGDLSGFEARHIVDADGGVVLPGFVDAHTHVVFGGTRVEEYAATVAERDPPAHAPTGILGTTAVTRRCSVDDLVQQAGHRIREMTDHGTTTIESKSGYGLHPLAELRLLEASCRLDQEHPADIVTTYLGAHAFPPDLDREAYVRQVIEQIPQVAERRLAQFCDVYCDAGYFDLDQTRRILRAGVDHGLRPKVHLDAYTHTGAAGLAIELGAVSVDHLNLTPVAEVERLAAAGVVGVYMPCLDYMVRHPAPVRPRILVDAGMELALATDICPGCWTTSMQLAIAMACRAGLSVAHAVRAATYGAARALDIEHRTGSIEVGKQADVLVLDIPQYEDIAYRLGRNSVSTVIKSGRVVREKVS